MLILVAVSTSGASPLEPPVSRVESSSKAAIASLDRGYLWVDDTPQVGWLPKGWQALDAARACGGIAVLGFDAPHDTYAVVLDVGGVQQTVWSTSAPRGDVLMAAGENAVWLVHLGESYAASVACDASPQVVRFLEDAPHASAPRSQAYGRASKGQIWWGASSPKGVVLHSLDTQTGAYARRLTRLQGSGPVRSIHPDGTEAELLAFIVFHYQMSVVGSNFSVHGSRWGDAVFSDSGQRISKLEVTAEDFPCVSASYAHEGTAPERASIGFVAVEAGVRLHIARADWLSTDVLVQGFWGPERTLVFPAAAPGPLRWTVANHRVTETPPEKGAVPRGCLWNN